MGDAFSVLFILTCYELIFKHESIQRRATKFILCLPFLTNISYKERLMSVNPQWNPVNKDTKGTCHSVRIIRVSVLGGLSEKTSGTHVLSI